MPKDFAEAATADILDGFAAQMRAIATAAEQRAELTATAYAQGKRVKVTVNADGAVLETRFSADIGDLDYDEIARAVTAAAQEAAKEAARKAQELLAPVAEQRARMPKLSDLIDGMPDLESHRPSIPPASMAPLSAREQPTADPMPTGSEPVEDYESWRAARATGVTDEGW
ncbi:YbaB/EbfC family nucleoid-associated protein [Nocardia farcinica]|uniref:YbaB/EbfC family nucleoid-associated protein n=1 Tax=Nocardia farcinica TaxID=37329 RepID=UPI002457227E|nr:YbaB/EbfC family nucleoid-associated protein [Nocardia farcinica]